jgi:hypothetical protein
VTSKTIYTVTLRQENGRWVKEAQRHSKYAAKKLADAWNEKYDHTFYVEIAP